MRFAPSVIALIWLGCGGAAAPPEVARPATPAPSAPAGPALPKPPVAEQRPYDVVSPNGTRSDPYYWLRDDTRKDKAMLGYLEAEQAYTNAVLAPLKTLEDTVFAEMRSHMQEDDSSVPTVIDGYWYYHRYVTGKQHPIYVRRWGTLESGEEFLLDGNKLAEGHAYYKIDKIFPSRDGRLIAWTEDTVGRRQFALRIKDMTTGKILPDTATNISPNLAWANDNKTLYYVGKDPTTLREDRVFRHVLGGSHDQIFKEDDAAFYVGVKPTKSRRFVMIELWTTASTETRLIDADKPAAPIRVFLPRAKDHLYSIDHLGNRFVMRTNADAKNFRLVEITPGNEAKPTAWKDLIAHRSDALVEDFAVYDSFIAAEVRTGGLRKIQVLPAKQPAFFLDAPDASYAMTLKDTPEPTSKRVRYEYDAMQTPKSTFEVEIANKLRHLVKQEPVPGYDESKYTSEYLHATASDGTKVPISVVYRKDTPRNGTAPLVVIGYGSYGYSLEPTFQSTRLSLLDRGWIVAIAHIRGGQEMGRSWYDDGKLQKKINTFTDFIAVTEHLVAAKIGARDQVFAYGASAGGLLMGAIANMRPELYRGIYTAVPFVDVVTTMLDESIPLTTNEFDEWGNPKEKAAYDYMLSYSPYDNIKRQRYPALYVHTGLWDSQVQYFEPAKWVAKLRAMKTDANPLVFDIDMTSGHSGAAGRFDSLRQAARAFAFVIHIREQPRS